MPVGDVNSNEPGSGARYNDGKPDLSMIPLWIPAYLFGNNGPSWTGEWRGNESEDYKCSPNTALVALAEYQMMGNLAALYRVARWLYGPLTEDKWEAICDAADVFSYGAKKYAAWNWTKGMPWSVPVACAARHICAIIQGEEMDPESGLPHAGHVMCNIIMLLHYYDTYPEGNDLPWRNEA